ncbi:MAG: class I SAM-dependent methyltransferase [Phycisphaerales bacterium]|nr:class I SAM-dependent methyltransferase [Phycisphaerales bacterium]
MSLMGQCYYRLAGTRAGRFAARQSVRAVQRLGGLREFHAPIAGLDLPYRATRELMRLWRRLHWMSGDGMMSPRERLAIYRLACSVDVPGDIVELGAWKGLTTCYLAAACRARGAGRVYAVDTFEGTREHDTHYASIGNYGGSTLPTFRKMIARAGVDDVVTPCVGYTTEVAEQYRFAPIAMLLIDADHSYEGVKADFEAYAARVVPGGLIVFHDYAMPDAGVRAFVQQEVSNRTDVDTSPGEVLPNVFAVTRREPADYVI